MELSYYDILKHDRNDYNSCQFNWDCQNCTRNLCVHLVSVAELPTLFGDFLIIAFYNNKDEKDHIAIVKGDIGGKEKILTRLHSSCLTGDAFGSMRCDCGPQLHVTMAMMEQEGLGLLIYMQQEGRGIGLANKIRAYELQDQGMDTYEANVHLGFEPDARDYEVSAAMIKKLDVKSIRLLTNNPEKELNLREYGIDVAERVPLQLPANENNLFYLQTKKERFGHKLEFKEES